MIQKVIRMTAAEFAANNWVINPGTRTIETDTGKVKEGDGTTRYNSLDYSAPAGKDVVSAGATIATTNNTDVYVIAPMTGKLDQARFCSVGSLAANDTNYVTFSVTNLSNSDNAMLAASDANTTKATGGTALAAEGTRSHTLHGTAANLAVSKGDLIRIRYAATGTLAGTVTNSLTMLSFCEA